MYQTSYKACAGWSRGEYATHEAIGEALKMWLSDIGGLEDRSNGDATLLDMETGMELEWRAGRDGGYVTGTLAEDLGLGDYESNEIDTPEKVAAIVLAQLSDCKGAA